MLSGLNRFRYHMVVAFLAIDGPSLFQQIRVSQFCGDSMNVFQEKIGVEVRNFNSVPGGFKFGQQLSSFFVGFGRPRCHPLLEERFLFTLPALSKGHLLSSLDQVLVLIQGILSAGPAEVHPVYHLLIRLVVFVQDGVVLGDVGVDVETGVPGFGLGGAVLPGVDRF
jgi:hypothetical protein